MTKYTVLSDLEIWDLFKSGDRDAFAELYERYFGILYVHARNRVRDEEEARDLIQELFTDLWSLREKISIKNSLSNFLYTCVRNRVLNSIARKGVQDRYQSSLVAETMSEAITDHRVRERLLARLIEQEIDALPPRMKEVFLLSRRANMTYVEIAGKLDITEQSVRSHVKNALRVLRVKLGILLWILLFFYQ